MSDHQEIDAQFEREAEMNENSGSLSGHPEEVPPNEASEGRPETPPRTATSTATDPELSSIVNEISLTSRQRHNKGKASDTSDHERLSSKPKKIPKGPRSNTVVAPSSIINRVQDGKLPRIKSSFSGPVKSSRKVGRDVFELEEGPREDQHESRPTAGESERTGQSPTTLGIASRPRLRNVPQLINYPTTRGYNKKGKEKASKRPSEAVKESPSRNLRSRKVNQSPGHTPQKHVTDGTREQHKPRPQKKTKVQPEDCEEGENGTNNQQEDADRAVATSLQNPQADEDDGAGVPDSISLFVSDEAEKDPASKSKSRIVGETDEQSEVTETPDGAIPREAPAEANHRNRSSDEAAQGTPSTSDESEIELFGQDEAAQGPGEAAQDQLEIELFGQDEAWSRIMAAKDRVGVSKIKGQEKRDIPKLQTRDVTALVGAIDEATRLYTSSIIDSSTGSAVPDELVDRPQELFGKIQESIHGLSESSVKRRKKGKVIQDVYAHAIPKMVGLLGEALKARSTQLSKRDNISALEEIIRIQDMLDILCHKARNWDAKPNTNRPIIQPTRAIRPSLQALRTAFQNKLEERKRRLRARENHAKSTQTEEESIQQGWEEARRKQEARNQIIWKAINQKPWAQRRVLVLQPSQPRVQVADQWSDDQEEELLTEIFADELEGASGEASACRCFLR